MKQLRLALLAAVSLTVVTSTAAQRRRAQVPDLTSLDPLIASAMAEWHVPGLALGVIKDGKVIHARGYGFRDVEQKLPATPRTLMAIGSNSKSFTVVLMAMLVDRKQLAWDTPVQSYLPDFRLYDEYATKNMTPRDLVSHRSGLPRHDNMWYGRNRTRKEIYGLLRYLEPTASFRGAWQYQNLMYMTAGYLVEQLWGRSWDDLIRDQIFAPLGMTRSNTSVRDLPRSDDFAWPYEWQGGALVKVPYRNIDHVGPAGSINSSVEDMLKYIQLRIDQGAWNGQQLVSKANETEMQWGQMAMAPAEAQLWSGFDLVSYGLGVGVGSYRGHRVVIHGGGIDGFISQMSWLPDDKVGVMVLTNLGGDNPLPTMLVQMVYDRVLGLVPIDYPALQRDRDKIAAQRTDSAKQAFAAARKPGTSPGHGPADYAGAYEHPGYGRLTIGTTGTGLELVMDDLRAALKHYHYEAFEIDDPGNTVPLRGLITFSTNGKGEVDRVSVPFEPAGAPIQFTRVRP